MLFKPKVIFTNDMVSTINSFTEKYNDTLVLYLTNKERFYGIGAGNLYDAFNNMPKYAYAGKYTVADVLTKEEVWGQDILLNVVFLLVEICNCYIDKKLGYVFKIARNNGKSLNKKAFSIRVHEDKKVLHDKLEKLVAAYQENESTIGSFLKKCHDDELIDEEYYGEIIEDENYTSALEVALSEVLELKEYLSEPYVSTQHGVKGESHDTVLFVAENNSRTPVVNMSIFFNLWSKIDVVLGDFDSFYYSYMKMIKSVEDRCNKKISEINADDYKQNEIFISEKITEFDSIYSINDYYNVLLKVSAQ